MESVITVGFEIIKAINAFITALRSMPHLVNKIRAKSQQLSSNIRALSRKFQIYILRDADMEGWLEHQRICNTTLGKIEDLLEEYAKGSTARVPIFYVTKFQFGPKKELSGLIEDLEKCVQFFDTFNRVVQSQVPAMLPPQQHNHQSSRAQEPVVSIDQFVRIQLDMEAGLREDRN